MKNIPIFFTFDDNYVVPAAVAFDSLLEKAGKDVFYDMYVLHHDITEDNQKLLNCIVATKGNAKLTFKDTGKFLRDDWNATFNSGSSRNEVNQFTVDTVIRCFAARFFPQFDRIIYSDVDVIFMDDISELWDIDLSGSYIGAVLNAFMKWDNNELSHLSPENYAKFKDSYFAGGIWVLNLAKIREDKLEKRMLEIVKNPTIVKRWNDQDVMNLACDNKVTYISLRYISYPYLEDFMAKEGFDSHYSLKELIDSIKTPKILHFAALKPWNAYPRYWDVWMERFDHLGIPRTKIFKKRPLKHKIYFSIWKYLTKYLKRKNIVH